MRGEVEVWKGDSLVLKQPNMLVDGAGELLADVMTVSPSLSGVEDHATSSILDASNYRINAISFGTGSDAFRHNGHFHDAGADGVYNQVSSNIITGARSNVATFKTLAGLDSATRQASDPYFPKAPSPVDRVLQQDTSVSANITNYEVSALIPSNGQLQNFLPSAIVSGYFNEAYPSEGEVLDLLFRAGSVVGCWPDGSSAPHSTLSQVIYYEDGLNDPTNNTPRPATPKGGFFNEVSSMDMNGYVNMVMSSVPNGGATGFQFSGGASGLCLSAEAEVTNKGFPFVEYTVMLAADDCLFANAYGGITDLGLWTIDTKKTLQAGNSAPFSFSVVNNPRQYKLFCRKGFSTNIVAANNITQYEDMTIKWRIHFR